MPGAGLVPAFNGPQLKTVSGVSRFGFLSRQSCEALRSILSPVSLGELVEHAISWFSVGLPFHQQQLAKRHLQNPNLWPIKPGSL